MFASVTDKTVLTIDTETTGLDKLRDKPFLVQIQTDEGPNVAIWETDKAVAFLNDHMDKVACNVFHNAKYDLHQLTNIGLSPDVVYRSKLHCTMVTEALIDEHQRDYHLDTLGKKYTGRGKSGEDELYKWLANKFGGVPDRKHQISRIQHAPRDIVEKYALGDTDLTYEIYKAQAILISTRNLSQIYELEMRTLFALYEIERRGVPINASKIPETTRQFQLIATRVAAEIEDMVGKPVNPRSGLQLKAAFQKFKLPITYTAKKNPCFNAEVLESIDHPLCKLILQQRTYEHMINTFLNGFEKWVYEDGRIRCDFNQVRGDKYGVKTGRLSSSNPNLQQVPNPKRKNREIAELVRSLFEAPPKSLWISSDWEQFEFRIFGHYVGDENLLKAFEDDPTLDYHQVVADLTGLARNPFAKQLNLALIFGMSEGKMAKTLGMPYKVHGEVLRAGKEAKAIFNQYHRNLPKVRSLLKRVEMKAQRTGSIRTICGRQLHFPQGKGAYKAGGLLFQGSAADLMKLKLCELNDCYRNTDVELILVVHDDYNLLAPESMAKEVKDNVVKIMQDMPQLKIPILADAGFGKNWFEASK